jgi:DNA-binding response OmpR family regulator
MRAYLRRLLRGAGWEVDAVADVDAALERAAEADVIVSDVMLPGRDGLDLVRAVRHDASGGLVPIILVTARAGPESAVDGLSAGADDYVVKPFAPAELVARVQVHMELSRLRAYALAQAQDEAANLRSALTSNRQIGAAVGILMQQRMLTADDAFALLRTTSQHANRKLRDVAADVVETGALPDA